MFLVLSGKQTNYSGWYKNINRLALSSAAFWKEKKVAFLKLGSQEKKKLQLLLIEIWSIATLNHCNIFLIPYSLATVLPTKEIEIKLSTSIKCTSGLMLMLTLMLIHTSEYDVLVLRILPIAHMLPNANRVVSVWSVCLLVLLLVLLLLFMLLVLSKLVAKTLQIVNSVGCSGFEMA